MMKDILIIGLVGLLWELLSSDRGELLTVVLFSLLVFFAIARNLRSRDIAVICGIGLLWEIILSDSRSVVTIVLFGLPLFRLVFGRAISTAKRSGRRLPTTDCLGFSQFPQPTVTAP